MANKRLLWRKLHRTTAPIMVLPILLTLVTGSLYQAFDLEGKGDKYDWLLELHKGHFGSLNLEIIYPFLNALGLLVLAITGILLWIKTQRLSNRHS
ncbi:MAG: hypothetical protein JOZ78_10640 [Chroococcidiopsidaceae cyanobacterium CP_BM_ER_R8_30]|nr:hypothetical protein [Chroococcidiopsidaceae cyanobacterium CP_BM_ER_R8_30]